MQTFIIAVILLLCLLYVGYRTREAIKHANDKCHGCWGCALKDLKDLKNCKKK